jgi:nucleoside-diphosphate kinase
MQNHPKDEQTLVLIKPDGIQRTLIGEIIKRYERIGLKLAGIKMLVPTEEFVERHYTLDPEWRRVTGEKRVKAADAISEVLPSRDPIVITGIILGKLKKYLSSGPVVAMVWQGANAVAIVRKITGGTEPLTSDIGTIRGDYVLDSYANADADGRSVRNLVHASGSVIEAEKEISLWFKTEELINYRLVQEQIIYDVNLDGILE